MTTIFYYPFLVLGLSLGVLWLSVWLGAQVAAKTRPITATEREELGMIVTIALTLLALIIGFTFSMAVGRYDQRKSYEIQEASAIDTEYFRVDMLAATDAAAVRSLLTRYLDQRLLFYTTRNEAELEQIGNEATKLQKKMWAILIRNAAAVRSTLPVALVVSGMNDVLNSRGYTQAAWWNRIPTEAWGLMRPLPFVAAC